MSYSAILGIIIMMVIVMVVMIAKLAVPVMI